MTGFPREAPDLPLDCCSGRKRANELIAALSFASPSPGRSFGPVWIPGKVPDYQPIPGVPVAGSPLFVRRPSITEGSEDVVWGDDTPFVAYSQALLGVPEAKKTSHEGRGEGKYGSYCLKSSKILETAAFADSSILKESLSIYFFLKSIIVIPTILSV